HSRIQDAERVRRLAGQESQNLAGALGADGQERIRDKVDYLCRGRGSRALLRLDRRAKASRKRNSLAPTLHASAPAEHLVEGQSRKGARPPRQRASDAGRTRGDRARENRRPLGGRVRFASGSKLTARLRGGPGAAPEGEGVLQEHQRRESIRNYVAATDGEESRNPCEAHAN